MGIWILVSDSDKAMKKFNSIKWCRVVGKGSNLDNRGKEDLWRDDTWVLKYR